MHQKTLQNIQCFVIKCIMRKQEAEAAAGGAGGEGEEQN